MDIFSFALPPFIFYAIGKGGGRRGAGGSLLSVVALVACMPAGREGKRPGQFFFLRFRRLLFLN